MDADHPNIYIDLSDPAEHAKVTRALRRVTFDPDRLRGIVTIRKVVGDANLLGVPFADPADNSVCLTPNEFRPRTTLETLGGILTHETGHVWSFSWTPDELERVKRVICDDGRHTWGSSSVPWSRRVTEAFACWLELLYGGYDGRVLDEIAGMNSVLNPHHRTSVAKLRRLEQALPPAT